jgi:hypothetical protein
MHEISIPLSYQSLYAGRLSGRLSHPAANPLRLSLRMRDGESLAAPCVLRAELHTSRYIAANTTPLAVATAAASPFQGEWNLDFTSAQMNQPTPPEGVRKLWLVVYATEGSTILYTFAGIDVDLGWHAISQATPPPPSVPLLADVGGSPWVTAVAYQTNHIVGNGGAIYLAVSPHTSSAATQPGVGAEWQTVWALFQGGGGGGGNTILSGAGAPSNLVGAAGDYWINTTAWLIYGPKAAGVWPAGVSLIGPVGPTGATGAAGTAATIAVGTVTTGAPGTSVIITNSGTSYAAIFDFVIPRGDTGASGVLADGDRGDITVSGSGAIWTIDAGSVTYGKIQNVIGYGVLANPGAALGSVQEVTLNSDQLLGRSSSGNIGGIACTAAGRALLDDATAQEQVRTLTTISSRADTNASFALSDADNGTVIITAATGAINVTVPSSLSAGFSCLIVQGDTGQLTFVVSGTTINSYNSLTKTAGRYAAASLVRVATNTFILSGQLA